MFAMNRQITITRILIVVLLVFGLSCLTGCHKREGGSNLKQPEFTPDHLTIMGNGVESAKMFTLSELKGMEEDQASECYSIVNDWPTKKIMVGKGIKISNLLEKAGIKTDAQVIIVWSADGYNAIFTGEQLNEKRFCFPKLLEDTEEGAKEVPAILAWEYREGTSDLSMATSCKLCLLLGQKGLNNSVAPVCVKDVVTLEVLTESPGCWDEAQASPKPGKVEPGTEIFLNHPEQDKVKIYYTIDGSTPDEKSLLYNPSTTYYQPDLNKPIIINDSMTIKTIAIGFGKHDSQISTFVYKVE
jgi:hypothetical protein